MTPSSLRRPATVLIALMLVLPALGCGGSPATPAATPMPSPATATPATTTAEATTSPTTTGPGPMTAQELAWLAALDKLAKQMNDVYSHIPTNLTATAMAATAYKLRGCSRGLARMGSPSARLQPAYTLVKKACQAYDKGATCFATAASIGIPLGGSPNARKQSQAIDCGFASSGTGGVPMADAQNKGEEIKASAP
jgi:hypothetical protein